KIDMKRSWNWSLWIGFFFALAGFFSYTFFAQFPITRDFPWANLLLFAAGGICLVVGLFRAFGNARAYRGKIFGPILSTLAILIFGLFSYVLFYDLLHRGAGPKGTDIARPAEFLIDSSGIIRWLNLTENIAVRARPEQVLEAFEQGEQVTSQWLQASVAEHCH